jgi:hypothetical protein
MIRTDDRPGKKADMIAHAREMAAQGITDYQTALDMMARDEGVSDWASLQAVTAKDGPRIHPGGMRGYVMDTTAMMALFSSSIERTRKRDEIFSTLARPILFTLARLPGSSPMRTQVLLTAFAVCLTTISVLLSVRLMGQRMPAGSYGQVAPYFTIIGTMIDAWLVSRSVIMSVDPLRPVCRDMRTNAVTLCAFRTLLVALPGWEISGSDVRPEVIVQFAALLLSGPAWLMTMYAGVFAKEGARHGE